MRISGRRSSDDDRDYPYARRAMLSAPSRVSDWSPCLPPAYDQGPVGDCEANAGAALMWCLYRFRASRMAIQYAGRKKEGSLGLDLGIETRDLMKVLQAGVVSEVVWPYDLSRYDEQPPVSADFEAIGTYTRLRGVSELLDHLSFVGPVVCAFNVPGQFLFDGTFPKGPWTSQGWHCVILSGHDLDHGEGDVRFLNSWGPSWQDHGYGWMPISWAVGPATGDDLWSACVAIPDTVAGVLIT